MRDHKLWTWHVGAGIVILVLLGLHMAIMHLDDTLGIFNPAGGHGIDWKNVVARGQHAAFLVIYVLLLGTALYHGFYGLRNIVFELGIGPQLKRGVSWVLLLAGIGLFVLGTWAAWAGFRLAGAL